MGCLWGQRLVGVWLYKINPVGYPYIYLFLPTEFGKHLSNNTVSVIVTEYNVGSSFINPRLPVDIFRQIRVLDTFTVLQFREDKGYIMCVYVCASYLRPLGHCLKFSSPGVEFALFVLIWKCVIQTGSDANMTTRYLAWFTSWQVKLVAIRHVP